jgi:hypothetical protein
LLLPLIKEIVIDKASTAEVLRQQFHLGSIWIYPKSVCSIYRLNHSANIHISIYKNKKCFVKVKYFR